MPISNLRMNRPRVRALSAAILLAAAVGVLAGCSGFNATKTANAVAGSLSSPGSASTSSLLPNSDASTSTTDTGTDSGSGSGADSNSGSNAGSSTSSSSVASTITCGESVVNKAGVDALSTLQACVDSGATTINLPAGRYWISSTLNLGSHSNLTIQTLGVNSGPACLQVGASPCAILTATANNMGPVILDGKGATNLQFRYFAVDGNIAQRRAVMGDGTWTGGTAYNTRIHSCQSCTFEGFATVRAASGTGFEFDGDNAVFNNILVRDNGWGIMLVPGKSQWADGLTVWTSKNLKITNSTFLDNSDVNLIIGNAPNAVITNNVIGNVNNFAFAALMLDNFNDSFAGDYTGAEIHDNTISCGFGMCGLGIDVGPHMWYQSSQVNGGSIYNNSVLGARQGILTYGAKETQIYGNSIGIFGNYTNTSSGGSCSTSFVSYTPGDGVNIHDNNNAVTSSGLVGCTPQTLYLLLSNFAGVDPRISQIYRDVLGRDPDQSGVTSNMAALKLGESIASIRTRIAWSQEAQNRLADYYRRIFGREIDSSGQQSWTNYLIGGGSLAQAYVKLQLSQEGLNASNGFEDRNLTR